MARAVGIDLGTNGVRVVELQRDGNMLKLRRYLTIDRRELAKRGVEDVKDTAAVAQVVASECLERGIRLKGQVALGITGRESIVRYMSVPPMPPWRLKLVMNYELQETSAKAGEKLQADYRLVPVPLDIQNEFTVLMAMVKDEPVSETLEAFAAAGINVSAVLPNSVALANAWRFLGEPSSEARKAEILVDLGEHNAEVALSVSGDIIFARSMVSGGEMFTERLAQAWGVERDEAESSKRRGRGPDGQDIADDLRQSFSQVGSLLSASFGFAKSQLKASKLDLERVVVTGGASRTVGLEEALGESLDAPVVSFAATENLDLAAAADDGDRENASVLDREATLACGLAATMLRPNAFRLDLLPEAWRKRREFRTQTVWLIGAAAALLLYAGVTTVSAMSHKSVASNLRSKASARLDEVEGRVEELERVDQDNRGQLLFMRRLVARTRAAGHLGEMLSWLNQSLPPRVTLKRVSLVEDSLDGPSAGASGAGRTGSAEGPAAGEALQPWSIQIEGEADDADGQARLALRELERKLGRLASVKEARRRSLSEVSGRAKVTFALVVRFDG